MKEDIQACLLFASQSLSNTTFMPLVSKSAQMRFVVEEYTGPAVAHWLEDQSHDVFSVFEEALGMTDDDPLHKAYIEN
jgi:hypothetical protein